MRFHLSIASINKDVIGTERAEITYSASNWEAAGRAAERYQRDLGMDGPSYTTTVTYASERDAPKSALVPETTTADMEQIFSDAQENIRAAATPDNLKK